MLVLSRKMDERIHIGNDVTVVVLGVRGGQVRLGIEAPQGIRIRRHELLADAPETSEAENASPPS